MSTINITGSLEQSQGKVKSEHDKHITGLAWTRDHFPIDDFHPTIEFMMTAFSCQESILLLFFDL